MRIRTKISLSFVFVGTVAFFVIGFIMQPRSSEILREQVYSHLEAVAHSKATNINNFLKEQEEKIRILATHPGLTNEDLTEVKDIDLYFYEVFIINPDGIIIASSDESKIGLDRSNDVYFINARDRIFFKDVYFSETTNRYLFTVSTPYGSGSVLVARIELSPLEEIIMGTAWLGETENIYLVNRNGYLIISSQFTEEAVLSKKIDTENVKRCFLHDAIPEKEIQYSHEEISTGLDYRDYPVLGKHIYIPEMEWCLIAEMSEEEALAPSLNILLIYFEVSSGVLLIYFILAWMLSRNISRPVESLREKVEMVEKGSFNYRVGINSNDEVGQLSRSFDKMTNAIKRSRAEVERKVKQQTKEIVKNQEYLKDQQDAILNILEDVQEEKDRAEREKEKIGAILHGIGDGVFVLDENLNIVMFNQVASEISGYSAREVIGKRYDKILNFIYEKDRKTNNKFIHDAFFTGEIQEMTRYTLLIRKDKTEVTVADSAAPLKDKSGKVVGCVVVFRDISKEREVDRAKSEFISVASHQLRTPLSGIKWFVELLLNEKAGKLNKKQSDFLNQVFDSNERMIELVNDLLDVSRIETGKRFNIQKKKLNVVPIVRRVLQDNIAFAKKKNVKIIECADSPKKLELFIDGEKISQVFNNLINNAIKYSKQKGVVEIGCKHDKKGRVVFFIEDNGLGIPKKEQKKVFQKFFRGENVAREEVGGTGLGLYIAKAIVEGHGGKIWFKSAKDKGTIFYFSLPRNNS